MNRTEFSKRVRLAVWQRSNGHCEQCGIKIVAGLGPEYHHVLEAALGGEATEENALCVCIPCHRGLTRSRRFEMDKTRRVAEKHAGLRKPKRPMHNTRFRKGMDGHVYDRETGERVR